MEEHPIGRYQIVLVKREDGKEFSVLLDTQTGANWRATQNGPNPLQWDYAVYNNQDPPHPKN